MKVILAIVGLIIIYVAYYLISPLFISIEVNEEVPVSSSSNEVEEMITTDNTEGAAIKKSSIVGTSGHPASGTVRIVEADDAKFLRYEDFKTINGPDLFVYLATDLEATEFINLGDLKGTEGNINYEIPEGTDLNKYRYALVWCKQFGVLFNSADLASI